MLVESEYTSKAQILVALKCQVVGRKDAKTRTLIGGAESFKIQVQPFFHHDKHLSYRDTAHAYLL